MKEHIESDIGVASFLLTRGFKLTGMERLGPNRYGFRFSDPGNTAADQTQSYFSGALAEAKALLDAQRNLKSQLYAVKGRDEWH